MRSNTWDRVFLIIGAMGAGAFVVFFFLSLTLFSLLERLKAPNRSFQRYLLIVDNENDQ